MLERLEGQLQTRAIFFIYGWLTKTLQPYRIIALMLGRLRMSVQECVLQYSKLGEDVFSVKRGFPRSAMFDEQRLESAVKRVIVSKLGEGQENAPLLDPLGNEDCCKT